VLLQLLVVMVKVLLLLLVILLSSNVLDSGRGAEVAKGGPPGYQCQSGSSVSEPLLLQLLPLSAASSGAGRE
jgi:hypothetical protein